MIEWDRPEIKPFVLEGEETFELTPDNCTVFMFRARPEVDHVYVKEPPRVIFNSDFIQLVLIGQVPTDEGFIQDTHGWRAKAIVEDYPTEGDVVAFERFLLQDIGDLAVNGLPDDWPEA